MPYPLTVRQLIEDLLLISGDIDQPVRVSVSQATHEVFAVEAAQQGGEKWVELCVYPDTPDGRAGLWKEREEEHGRYGD